MSLRIAGVRSSTAWLSGSLPDARTSRSSGLVQVGRRPLGHQQGRVALVDRLAGEEAVALVVHVALVLEDRRVLVLERVVVLVREVEALGRTGLAALGDDVELALDIAIEGRDRPAQQVDRQVAQARTGRDEPERLVEPLAAREVRGRGLRVEVLGEHRLGLGRGDELARDRLGRLETADPDDLLLDRVVDRIEGGRGARRRRDRGRREGRSERPRSRATGSRHWTGWRSTRSFRRR